MFIIMNRNTYVFLFRFMRYPSSVPITTVYVFPHY